MKLKKMFLGGNKNNSGGKYGRKSAMARLGNKAEIIFPKYQQNKEMKYRTEKRLSTGESKSQVIHVQKEKMGVEGNNNKIIQENVSELKDTSFHNERAHHVPCIIDGNIYTKEISQHRGQREYPKISERKKNQVQK